MEIISDTHFELGNTNKMKRKFKKKPVYYMKNRFTETEDSYCVPRVIYVQYFLDIVVSIYDHVFFTPGNHEYWNIDLNEANNTMRSLQEKYKNVRIFTLGHNSVLLYNGVIIYGSTLWNHIPLEHTEYEDELRDITVISL